jgi:hypothetical protein
MGIGLQTCIRLARWACLHARSLDEIRAPRPWQQFGLFIGRQKVQDPETLV